MIIGIDLGTTHCVVAYVSDDVPQLFDVPQLVAVGQSAARQLLPSYLYAPLDNEAAAPRFQLTQESDGGWICGELARSRGGEVSGRMVSSAKSWLSYAQVDRRAAILPWRLSDDEPDVDAVPRVSPVRASALMLEHIKRMWDEAHPARPLGQQQVVLTVPASFDAVARELTVQAARDVGLGVRLLEEPQAAFYDFMRRGGDEALSRVIPDDHDEGLVLVCDVGGGTTDLSLMRVKRAAGDAVADGKVEVDRVAVGKHLLLGGDNMDLALAHLCEQRLIQGGDRLEPRRFAQLVAACRAGKEALLGNDAPDKWPIAVASRGSQLVGGTLKTELSRQEVEQVVLDGFFPEIALDAPEPAQARAGIVAFGLRYEREVAITRHLARFVKQHTDESARPSALLLNGGVFRAPAIRRRICETLSRWTDGAAVELQLNDPDTSVALGAAAYGLALEGRARRIGGGAARSFYLGLRGSGGPDRSRAQQAVCVLPRGTEEGHALRADAHALELTVGRRVRFDLYASDGVDEVGSVVALDDSHDRLAPLVTKLDDYGVGQKEMRVALEAELSAVGTLELSCVEVEPAAGKPRRFALAFELRAEDDVAAPTHEQASATARYGKRLDEAREAIEQIYSKKARKDVETKDVKGLVRKLEKIFGKRTKWDATLSRTLFDVLWRHHRGRRASADHERVFWMLAGFCLRPGVGHARDEERAAEMFEVFDYRLAHAKELRGWQQFWIAWRRVAAGLDESAHAKLRDVLDPFLAPDEAGKKKPKSWRNDAKWEMLELAASLERAPAKRRAELGSWILERTWMERDARLWAALGRIGARVPTYGSAHHVVAARSIERWMDHLVREKWDQIGSAPRAAVRMCRVTGDRERDVAEATREKVASKLDKLDLPAHFSQPVRELVPHDDSDRAEFYGEDLPVGLRLAADHA